MRNMLETDKCKKKRTESEKNQFQSDKDSSNPYAWHIKWLSDSDFMPRIGK